MARTSLILRKRMAGDFKLTRLSVGKSVSDESIIGSTWPRAGRGSKHRVVNGISLVLANNEVQNAAWTGCEAICLGVTGRLV